MPTYTNHLLELQKGDRLYLSTDGFVDQHGGAGKKFGTNRLWALLEEICHLDMESQETRLLSELQAHQQEQLQRDDITFLGLSL
jgi:serine phosphatase RsbU (regulator of sigma subunit)